MRYGLIHLSIVPVRIDPSDTSEMVTQGLYGDTIKVLEARKKWSRIRFDFDKYEGWIDNKQYLEVLEEHYKTLSNELQLATDLIDFVSTKDQQLISLVKGSNIGAAPFLNHQFEGVSTQGKKPKSNLIETALFYLNTPYLWGGKTPFGIDCSGFTQMVYKLNGYSLLRDASQQATQGEALSFIEESEPGDLAFFDNAEGAIIHVGIIMEDHYIIHAHGQVRIDRLDHTGIFNVAKNEHTHKLRVIKKIV